MPETAGGRSPTLVTLLGALLYCAPLAVWLRFNDDIVSAGGLAAFVEAAAGRRLALVQAAFWTFSYFLYLPYTVIDIVHELLPDAFPGIAPWEWLLQLVVPVALVALVLAGTHVALRLLALSAAAQLVVLVALGMSGLRSHGPRALAAHPHDVLRHSAAVSLLFVCGSLPLFLGAEVRGGSRTIRTTLTAAAAIVAAFVAFALFGGVPSGRAWAIVAAAGSAVSVAGLIVAEYLALSRLLHAVTRVPVRRILALVAVPFVAIDALALTDPERFDHALLRPSLVALYVSQLIVLASYPLYKRRAPDAAIAGIASAVMAYGLWLSLRA
ncbi:MAG TPA: hypothetical protein VI408_14340 [Gaiellaceae bacterium]